MNGPAILLLCALSTLACSMPPPGSSSPADGAHATIASSSSASSSNPSPSSISSDSARADGAPAPAPDCARRPEGACLDSTDCTLILDEEAQGGYRCQTAVPPCETGFRQSTGTAEECEEKAGCHFVPGRCYCSPDVVCICGGGPPPQCSADPDSGESGAPRQ
jgi:hypothetical protein